MKVIGLTGGIGTGKSTAAAYLTEKGFAHIDADAISRELTEAGSPVLAQLDAVFGPGGEMGKPGQEILTPEGALDRKALAGLVFSDPAKKARLDQMLHGAIIEEIDQRIERLQAEDSQRPDSQRPDFRRPVAILLDAPLLFEAGLDSRCDQVLLLVSHEELRIQRVCQRDGVTTREVRNRINSQMTDQEKEKRAQVVLDNSGTQQQLYEKLDRWIGQL